MFLICGVQMRNRLFAMHVENDLLILIARDCTQGKNHTSANPNLVCFDLVAAGGRLVDAGVK